MSFGEEQVASESGHTHCDNQQAPGREEQPSGVGEKLITHFHEYASECSSMMTASNCSEAITANRNS